jgi:hypothetical protein
MRYLYTALIFAPLISPAQTRFAPAKFIDGNYPGKAIVFYADSTFEYESGEHPVFFRWEKFRETGKWTMRGDTVVLNPQLPAMNYVESEFSEEEHAGDTAIQLTFNHIKRYFDAEGRVIKADTIQVDQLDFAFNKWKRKTRRRVSDNASTRCTFAGFIPKEIITTSNVISVPKPADSLKSIFIGCYEMQGTKEFLIKNPAATRLKLNVYSNYYEDGILRQKKLLLVNDNVLYITQRKNGKFKKDGIWGYTADKVKRRPLL